MPADSVGAAAAAAPPPFVHAAGGAVGSALSLLLFYPLERARIEMQSLAGKDLESKNKILFDAKEPLLQQHQQPKKQLDEEARVHQQRVPTMAEIGETLSAPVPPSNVKSSDDSFFTNDSSFELLSKTTDPSLTATAGAQQQQQQQEQQVEEDHLSDSISSKEEEEPTNLPSVAEKSTEIKKISIIKCLQSLHSRGQLYRGVSPVVLTLGISNFVYFYFHEWLKSLLFGKPSATGSGPQLQQRKKSIGLSLLASCGAGIINVMLTNPLWVANMRIIKGHEDEEKEGNVQPTPGIFEEMKNILEKEGFAQLWSGTLASLLLVSNPVIQFFMYEQFKEFLLLTRTRRLTPVESFLSGALSKTLATVFTYPLILAQALLRLQKKKLKQLESQNYTEGPLQLRKQQFKGTLDCLVQLYQKGGVLAWYAGMNAKLLQTALTAAFTFLTYEEIVKVVQNTLMTVTKLPTP